MTEEERKAKTREYNREYMRKRREDPEFRAKECAMTRKCYAAHREQILERSREYYAAHREQVREYNTRPEVKERRRQKAMENPVLQEQYRLHTAIHYLTKLGYTVIAPEAEI